MQLKSKFSVTLDNFFIIGVFMLFLIVVEVLNLNKYLQGLY